MTVWKAARARAAFIAGRRRDYQGATGRMTDRSTHKQLTVFPVCVQV
jgi:hypothetical protein